MTGPRATADDWKHEPVTEPRPLLPSPVRTWTTTEMASIRCGFIPQSMDDKWFAYFEDDRLHLHRSWTGHGIYEVTFSSAAGGHVISTVIVTGDQERYRRTRSDADESAGLERLIVGLFSI